ncbi:hypothetical protein R6Q59_009388 [Mikania micrantha]
MPEMGTGWRRAFCTTVSRNSSDSPVLGEAQQPTGGKRGFFKSNPSTPRLNSNSNASTPRLPKINSNGHDSVIDNLNITPRLRCKAPKSSLFGLNPSSPRSPFSIFKTSLGFSRSNCGVCMQSVKTGHKTAIFTAECSHSFHFPCILNHVNVKHKDSLVCPICKTTWKDASFLNIQSNQMDKPKAYDDDDEPLVQTPTPRILPIPEVDNDVDEEFKGFLGLSSPSADNFKNVEPVVMMSEMAVISSNQSHDTYAVVLKVKAPPSHPTRAPIDLVAVLDVSASMAGTKLQMLKRAMRLLISSLGSSDRLSIVAFSASPKRLLALRKMSPSGQRSARRVIDHLSCTRGGTCAGEALKRAAKVLEDRRERNLVASIILLSDGHEEHLRDDSRSHQRQISSHVSSTRFSHVEIPVHTLEKPGRVKGGYSDQSHDPEDNAFTKCVGGLLSVVAQNLRIELGVALGSDPAEITAVYFRNGKLNPGSIWFGDLYAEEEKEVLIELRVPTGYSHHVLSARCCYKDPATQVIYSGEKMLLVPRPHQNTQRLRNLFIATRAVAESRLLVEHNNLRMAHQLLSSARDLLMQSMLGQEFVEGLESELVGVEWRLQQEGVMAEPLTPTSAEKLGNVALIKKPLSRVSDLNGFENARF